MKPFEFRTMYYVLGMLFYFCACQKVDKPSLVPDLSLKFETEDFRLHFALQDPIDSIEIKLLRKQWFVRESKSIVFIMADQTDTTIVIPIFRPEIITIKINKGYYKILAIPGHQGQIGLAKGISDATEVMLSEIDEYLSNLEPKAYRKSDGLWADQFNLIEKERDEKLDHLKKYEQKLPQWFVTYEKKNINYAFWQSLQSTYSYRNIMLGYKDPMPVELIQFYDTLSLSNNGVYTNSNYMQHILGKYVLPFRLQDENMTDVSTQELFVFAKDQISRSPSPKGQKAALYMYLMMQTSSKEFPEALENELLALLDNDHNNLLKLIMSERDNLAGSKISNATLLNEEGAFINLTDLIGKPIYLSFWFTSCIPCVKAIPAENELIDEFSNSDVEFVRVCTNSIKEEWIDAIVKHEIQSMNLFANSNWSQKLKKNYKLYAYPKYVFVDRDGMIKYDHGIAPGSEKIKEILRSL